MRCDKRKLLLSAGFLLAAAGAVILLSFFDPLHCRWLPKCVFYEFTGIYCPGCGATRALHAALHGDVMRSLHCNLLLFPLLLAAVILFWKPAWALKRSVAFTILIVVVGFAVLRNLPWYPFTLLAPIS